MTITDTKTEAALANPFRVNDIERRALDLIDNLDGFTAAEFCELMGWRRGSFDSALLHARNEICPALGLAIPHPIPDDGYRYRVTGDWLNPEGKPAIANGAAFAIGVIESRLRSVLRDVRIAAKNLDGRSVAGRKATYLTRQIRRTLEKLEEIGADGGPLGNGP
jgi:hypothetical protein